MFVVHKKYLNEITPYDAPRLIRGTVQDLQNYNANHATLLSSDEPDFRKIEAARQIQNNVAEIISLLTLREYKEEPENVVGDAPLFKRTVTSK